MEKYIKKFAQISNKHCIFVGRKQVPLAANGQGQDHEILSTNSLLNN